MGSDVPTFGYLNITLDFRNNVREPMPPPTMRLVRESGRIVTVPMNEAQLLTLIVDATRTLQRLRECRDARRPPCECGWIGVGNHYHDARMGSRAGEGES